MDDLCNGKAVGALDIKHPACKAFDPGQHFIGVEKETGVEIFVVPYFENLAAAAFTVQAV